MSASAALSTVFSAGSLVPASDGTVLTGVAYKYLFYIDIYFWPNGLTPARHHEKPSLLHHKADPNRL
jgi:hypothetical protein